MEPQLPGLYVKMTLADATLSMVGDVVASYSAQNPSFFVSPKPKS
jgi:hypothetical protein